MKSLKRILITIMSLLMLFTACIGMTACGEVKQLEIQVQVYDREDEEMKDFTLTVDLYRHLAPQTVDAVIKAAKDGYYDNAVFYTLDGYSGQVMVGDYKVNEENKIIKNPIAAPAIKGEFDRNGVVGNDILFKKGTIGIWRSWFASDSTYTTSSDARDSGQATLVMPTREKTAYDGWFCAFATIDLENEVNKEAFALIQSAMESSYFDQYTVYYTGEYDVQKGQAEDFGLAFNIATYADYNEMLEHGQIENLFSAAGQQLVKYNKQTIKVSETANNTNEIGAKIVKVTVK